MSDRFLKKESWWEAEYLWSAYRKRFEFAARHGWKIDPFNIEMLDARLHMLSVEWRSIVFFTLNGQWK